MALPLKVASVVGSRVATLAPTSTARVSSTTTSGGAVATSTEWSATSTLIETKRTDKRILYFLIGDEVGQLFTEVLLSVWSQAKLFITIVKNHDYALIRVGKNNCRALFPQLFDSSSIFWNKVFSQHGDSTMNGILTELHRIIKFGIFQVSEVHLSSLLRCILTLMQAICFLRNTPVSWHINIDHCMSYT